MRDEEGEIDRLKDIEIVGGPVDLAKVGGRPNSTFARAFSLELVATFDARAGQEYHLSDLDLEGKEHSERQHRSFEFEFARVMVRGSADDV